MKTAQDRHPEDVKAAVRKLGWRFMHIGPLFGYGEKSADRVLYRKWPAFELIIGALLDEPPWEIWPSRYAGITEEEKAGLLERMKGLRIQAGRPAERRAEQRRTAERRAGCERRRAA
jgi:lambda repressor-like predicted transcriptional regulator